LEREPKTEGVGSADASTAPARATAPSLPPPPPPPPATGLAIGVGTKAVEEEEEEAEDDPAGGAGTTMLSVSPGELPSGTVTSKYRPSGALMWKTWPGSLLSGIVQAKTMDPEASPESSSVERDAGVVVASVAILEGLSCGEDTVNEEEETPSAMRRLFVKGLAEQFRQAFGLDRS